MDTGTTSARRSIPWNKAKLLGQKPPLKLKEIWAIRVRLQLDHRNRELALSNLLSTASFADATWLGFASTMWFKVAMLRPARLSSRGRRSGRCNLRSPSKRERRLLRGLPRRI